MWLSRVIYSRINKGIKSCESGRKDISKFFEPFHFKNEIKYEKDV
jgi:hypothetical protein